MDKIYIELKENTWGIELANYNNLSENSDGIKIAKDMPDGTQLEVFDNTTGKIKIYAEAINKLWYER